MWWKIRKQQLTHSIPATGRIAAITAVLTTAAVKAGAAGYAFRLALIAVAPFAWVDFVFPVGWGGKVLFRIP